MMKIFYNETFDEWVRESEHGFSRLLDSKQEVKETQTSIDAVYGGKFIKAANLENSGLMNKTLTIISAKIESIVGKERLTLMFAETDKSFSLNATQARAIAEKHGKDYTAWRGKQVKLSLGKTEFPHGSGKMVDTINVEPI